MKKLDINKLSKDSNTEPYFSDFKLFLKNLINVPNLEWTYLKSYTQIVKYKKKERLLNIGDRPEYLYYIYKGLVKISFENLSGDTAIRAFRSEKTLVSSYVSILTKTNSNVSIECLEDCIFLKIPARIIPEMYGRHPSWQILGRILAENLIVERELREQEIMLLDALKRYESFLIRFPEIAARIPHYEIASYLGITPVGLSKIRAKRIT